MHLSVGRLASASQTAPARLEQISQHDAITPKLTDAPDAFRNFFRNVKSPERMDVMTAVSEPGQGTTIKFTLPG